MKKKVIAFLVLFALVLTVPGYAVQPRTPFHDADITFEGNQACCEVRIMGTSLTEDISATIKLWEKSQCIQTWHENDVGYLEFHGRKTVTPKETYKLTVNYTINGISQPQLSASNTCP